MAPCGFWAPAPLARCVGPLACHGMMQLLCQDYAIYHASTSLRCGFTKFRSNLQVFEATKFANSEVFKGPSQLREGPCLKIRL